jgi:hypothetical protein
MARTRLGYNGIVSWIKGVIGYDSTEPNVALPPADRFIATCEAFHEVRLGCEMSSAFTQACEMSSAFTGRVIG